MRRKKKSIILEKVMVEDYAAEGKSLAHIDGKVVFIEKAVPGDRRSRARDRRGARGPTW